MSRIGKAEERDTAVQLSVMGLLFYATSLLPFPWNGLADAWKGEKCVYAFFLFFWLITASYL